MFLSNLLLFFFLFFYLISLLEVFDPQAALHDDPGHIPPQDERELTAGPRDAERIPLHGESGGTVTTWRNQKLRFTNTTRLFIPSASEMKGFRLARVPRTFTSHADVQRVQAGGKHLDHHLIGEGDGREAGVPSEP